MCLGCSGPRRVRVTYLGVDGYDLAGAHDTDYQKYLKIH
jgi:hypothetical protein